MEFCGMKRKIDRKCLNHARVHANAQSFDRCEESGSTAVKRLGIRVNTRVILALPVNFPLHLTKFHGQPPPLEPSRY